MQSTSAVKKFRTARKALEQAIFDDLAKVASDINLDSMYFGVWKTELLRNGREVRSKKIRKLEELFLDEIHNTGFIGYWDKKTGWR